MQVKVERRHIPKLDAYSPLRSPISIAVREICLCNHGDYLNPFVIPSCKAKLTCYNEVSKVEFFNELIITGHHGYAGSERQIIINDEAKIWSNELISRIVKNINVDDMFPVVFDLPIEDRFITK